MSGIDLNARKFLETVQDSPMRGRPITIEKTRARQKKCPFTDRANPNCLGCDFRQVGEISGLRLQHHLLHEFSSTTRDPQHIQGWAGREARMGFESQSVARSNWPSVL